MINTLLKRRMENTKKNKKGFTLVELIVVLVIIAILAAILIPTMSGYIGRARKSSAQSSAKSMVTACAAAATDLVGAGKTVDVKKSDFTSAAVSYGAVFYKADATTDKCIYSVVVDVDGAVTSLEYKEGAYTVTYSSGKYTVEKKVPSSPLTFEDATSATSGS